MSFKPEVCTDSTGKFYGNALCFETMAEAEANASDLMGRWMMVREWRVVESTNEPNYRYINGQLEEIE